MMPDKDPHGIETASGFITGQPSWRLETRNKQQLLENFAGGSRDFHKAHEDRLLGDPAATETAGDTASASSIGIGIVALAIAAVLAFYFIQQRPYITHAIAIGMIATIVNLSPLPAMFIVSALSIGFLPDLQIVALVAVVGLVPATALWMSSWGTDTLTGSRTWNLWAPIFRRCLAGFAAASVVLKLMGLKMGPGVFHVIPSHYTDGSSFFLAACAAIVGATVSALIHPRNFSDRMHDLTPGKRVLVRSSFVIMSIMAFLILRSQFGTVQLW